MMLSTSNTQFKQFSKLATQAKVRRRESQTVLHGVHLAEAFFDHGLTPRQVVYSGGAEQDAEVAALLQRASSAGVEPLCFSANAQRIISGVDNGVGLALVIDTPQPEPVDTLGETALLLDTVQDPGNVGALIRTAAAAGVSSIYLSSGCASAWSPRSLRAGMGGQLAVTIYEECDLAQLMQRSQIPVLATSLGEGTRSVYDCDLTGPAAWLFGNEGSGVSPELLDISQKISIPQTTGVESLNVAASVAVCLFEQRRQSTAG